MRQEVCVAHRVGWLLMLLLARVVVHAAHLVSERAVPVLEFVQEVERRQLLALVAERDLAQAALVHVAHAVQNSTRKHQQHPSSSFRTLLRAYRIVRVFVRVF